MLLLCHLCTAAAGEAGLDCGAADINLCTEAATETGLDGGLLLKSGYTGGLSVPHLEYNTCKPHCYSGLEELLMLLQAALLCVCLLSLAAKADDTVWRQERDAKQSSLN